MPENNCHKKFLSSQKKDFAVYKWHY